MISLRPKHHSLLLRGDILMLVFTFLISVFFFRDNKISTLEWSILSGFIIAWLLIGYRRKSHESGLNNEFTLLVSNHIKAYSAFIALVSLSYLVFHFPVPGRSEVLAIVIGIPALGITTNYLLTSSINRLKSTKENTKYTLVAGIGSVAKNVERQLSSSKNSGYQIKGFIDCLVNERCTVDRNKVVGNLKDIQHYLKTNPVDEIVIALPGSPSKKIRNIISVADYHGIRVKYILDYREIFGQNYRITRYGQIDAVNVRQFPLDAKEAFFIKTCFDKLFAAATLTLLAPLLLLIAALIKLDSPGPVFYCPIRIGKAGKPFKVIKFRSMRENDDTSGGTRSTQSNDPRVSKVGRIMRKYNLDELPQFINVLLGDMSVVGPRPHRRYLNQQFQESVYKYMVRHYVKPGITGWAQVNGWRGPTETEEQKHQRTLHDLWYIENWSFWLDIKIIFLTIFSKKAHKNAF